MIQLSSITTWFATHGTLRKSQRTTIAALAWALMQNPVLGIAAMGRSLAMAGNTTAKHAIKRVNRFLGNVGVDLEVACGDLIRTVVGGAQEVVLALDWRTRKPRTANSKRSVSTSEPMDAPCPSSGKPFARPISKDGCANTKRPCANRRPPCSQLAARSSCWRTAAVPRCSSFAFWTA